MPPEVPSALSERRFVVTITPANGWPPVTRHSVEFVRSAVKRRLISRRTAGYRDGLDRSAWMPFFAAAAALNEAGGTIGPLPDGSVIEVVHVA